MKRYNKIFRSGSMLIALLLTSPVLASSAVEIDRDSNKALEVFRDEINGAEVFLDQAAGYLVFPRVIKIGIGVGAETGERVLRVGGIPSDYTRTTAG